MNTFKDDNNNSYNNDYDSSFISNSSTKSNIENVTNCFTNTNKEQLLYYKGNSKSAYIKNAKKNTIVNKSFIDKEESNKIQRFIATIQEDEGSQYVELKFNAIIDKYREQILSDPFIIKTLLTTMFNIININNDVYNRTHPEFGQMSDRVLKNITNIINEAYKKNIGTDNEIKFWEIVCKSFKLNENSYSILISKLDDSLISFILKYDLIKDYSYFKLYALKDINKYFEMINYNEKILANTISKYYQIETNIDINSWDKRIVAIFMKLKKLSFYNGYEYIIKDWKDRISLIRVLNTDNIHINKDSSNYESKSFKSNNNTSNNTIVNNTNTSSKAELITPVWNISRFEDKKNLEDFLLFLNQSYENRNCSENSNYNKLFGKGKNNNSNSNNNNNSSNNDNNSSNSSSGSSSNSSNNSNNENSKYGYGKFLKIKSYTENEIKYLESQFPNFKGFDSEANESDNNRQFIIIQEIFFNEAKNMNFYSDKKILSCISELKKFGRKFEINDLSKFINLIERIHLYSNHLFYQIVNDIDYLTDEETFILLMEEDFKHFKDLIVIPSKYRNRFSMQNIIENSV